LNALIITTLYPSTSVIKTQIRACICSVKWREFLPTDPILKSEITWNKNIYMYIYI
jgi:hypothetical protein